MSSHSENFKYGNIRVFIYVPTSPSYLRRGGQLSNLLICFLQITFEDQAVLWFIFCVAMSNYSLSGVLTVLLRLCFSSGFSGVEVTGFSRDWAQKLACLIFLKLLLLLTILVYLFEMLSAIG